MLHGLEDLSSLNRDHTCDPCPGRWMLRHWTLHSASERLPHRVTPAAPGSGAGQTAWASQAGEPSPHSVQPTKRKDSASWASKKCRCQAGLPGGLGLSRFSRHPEHSRQAAATWGATSVAPDGLTLRRWEGKLGSLLSPGAEPVCVVAVRPSRGWGPAAAGNPKPGLSPGDWPAWGQDWVGRGRPTGSALGTQAAGQLRGSVGAPRHSLSGQSGAGPGWEAQAVPGSLRSLSASRLLQPAQLSSLWCPGLRMRLLPANQEIRSEVTSPLPCRLSWGWDGPAGSEGQAGALASRPGLWQGPP